MAFRITIRTGPGVQRLEAGSLDGALALLEERIRELAGATHTREVALFRSYEPAQQVAHRAELAGPGGVRGGLDVRGDGSVEAWTGRWRRRPVERGDAETAYAALRRTLEA